MEKTVNLNSGESKIVEFSFTPTEARVHQVTVEDLNGSFVATPLAIATRLYGKITDSKTGGPVSFVDGILYQDYGTHTDTHHFTSDVNGNYEITDLIFEYDLTQMVIYAGGYVTKTFPSLTIREGDNLKDISLLWAGGDREVPYYIGYTLPSQIVSGGEFPASLTVWLPYQPERFRAKLTLSPIDGRADVKIQWGLLPASLWDQCNEGTQDGYIRFDHEGQYTLEDTAIAEYESGHYHTEIIPCPPGIYNVEVEVLRNHVTVNDSGNLTSYGEDPANYKWSAVVGTVSIV